MPFLLLATLSSSLDLSAGFISHAHSINLLVPRSALSVWHARELTKEFYNCKTLSGIRYVIIYLWVLIIQKGYVLIPKCRPVENSWNYLGIISANTTSPLANSHVQLFWLVEPSFSLHFLLLLKAICKFCLPSVSVERRIAEYYTLLRLYNEFCCWFLVKNFNRQCDRRRNKSLKSAWQ